MQQDRISIIGVGGAGGRIVDQMAAMVSAGPAMAAVNTDQRALSSSRATSKVPIGASRTRGRGAGGDPNLGRLAAEDDVGMIRGLVAGMDLVVVVAGLGGGTGTGAVPIVLRTAREENALTLCLATLPLNFEGRHRREHADRVLPILRDAADALIVVPNERLKDVVGEASAVDTFARVDEILATGLCSLWKLLSKPGLITLDFADLQRVARQQAGLCTFGYGEGRGKGRAEAAIDSLLSSPLLEGGKVLRQARSVLVSVAGGCDMTLKEAEEVINAIGGKVPRDTEIAVGTVVDDDWRGRLTVTVIASEQWAGPLVHKAEPPAGGGEPQGELPLPGAKPGKRRQVQTNLRFEGSARGRFEKVEPTILDGQDFDIPTFRRKGIVIEQ